MQLVLDTNIILDWLVFHDACVDGLQQALDAKLISIVTHPPAIDELRRVLTYPQCKLDADSQKELLDRYLAMSRDVALPAGFALDHLLLPSGFPVCKDPDDQHFLALTYHAKATALVTKDRQVLKLRRRVRKFGVTILDPRQFREQLQSARAVALAP